MGYRGVLTVSLIFKDVIGRHCDAFKVETGMKKEVGNKRKSLVFKKIAAVP